MYLEPFSPSRDQNAKSTQQAKAALREWGTSADIAMHQNIAKAKAGIIDSIKSAAPWAMGTGVLMSFLAGRRKRKDEPTKSTKDSQSSDKHQCEDAHSEKDSKAHHFVASARKLMVAGIFGVRLCRTALPYVSAAMQQYHQHKNARTAAATSNPPGSPPPDEPVPAHTPEA